MSDNEQVLGMKVVLSEDVPPNVVGIVSATAADYTREIDALRAALAAAQERERVYVEALRWYGDAENYAEHAAGEWEDSLCGLPKRGQETRLKCLNPCQLTVNWRYTMSIP